MALFCVISTNSSSFRAHCVKVHVRYLISWWVLVCTAHGRMSLYTLQWAASSPTKLPLSTRLSGLPSNTWFLGLMPESKTQKPKRHLDWISQFAQLSTDCPCTLQTAPSPLKIALSIGRSGLTPRLYDWSVSSEHLVFYFYFSSLVFFVVVPCGRLS